jgi:RNA polymerase sigma-70 factor (ECF subfamily)
MTSPVATDHGSLPPFEQVYRDFRRKVHGYLLGMARNPEEAEDLTQETFLKIERALPTFRGESSLATWVYRVATNTCLDHLKCRGKRESVSSVHFCEAKRGDIGVTECGSISPEKSAIQSEMSACVQDYVLELPPIYRAAIVLHDMQAFTNPEIADILGVTTGTVKIRLHRARAMLKAALDTGCAFEHDDRNVLVCEPIKLDAGGRR